MIDEVPIKNRSLLVPIFCGAVGLAKSYLDGQMGCAFTDDTAAPHAAVISVGDFCYFAGDAAVPSAAQLAAVATEGEWAHRLLIPLSPGWDGVLDRVFSETGRWVTRFATAGVPEFDRARLQGYVSALPAGYVLHAACPKTYRAAMENDWSHDLCGLFESEADYLARGAGCFVFCGDELVCGASAYLPYENGIEIEIDTKKSHRRRGLARVAAAALILDCLENGIDPHWDAANPESLALAVQLGYRAGDAYRTLYVKK